jgi:nicotinamidase-related amidase
MSNPIRPYEPLTSENAALVLVDHQVGLMTGVRDYSIAELKHNVVALAKAAKALKLPIVLTTTARDCPRSKSSTVPLSTPSMTRASRALSKRLAEGS